MKFDVFKSSSIKTRVVFVTLSIFVLSLWSLSLFATHELRAGLLDLTGAQQRSTVMLLAAQINDELEDRFAVLNNLAVTEELRTQAGGAGFQQMMATRPAIRRFFNAGVMLLGPDGTVLADAGGSIQRIGINYMNVEVVAAALRAGQSGIGPPVMARTLKVPVFDMVVPVRNAHGAVVGALYAVTDLSQTNFLDKVVGTRYGKTGGFMLVAVRPRLVVNATDKKLIMLNLPAERVDPLVNRFIQGYEGTGIAVNPLGIEVLGSAKGIPLAGWYIAVSLPTAEAFAPIVDMQQRMLLATLLLTLLAAGLTWWLLRRELYPLLEATQAVTRLAQSGSAVQHLTLPVVAGRNDEVGQLLTSVNRQLDLAAQREAKLRDGDEILGGILATTLDGYWRIDRAGRLIDVNATYCRLSGYAREELLGMQIPDLEAAESHTETQLHIRRLIETGREQFETRHRRKDASVWEVEVSVTFLSANGGEFMVFLRDVTERKHNELALLASRKDAERANQAKSGFLTSMSHELRTPLNSILGYAQLLQQDAGLSAAQHERVDEILSSGYQLLQMIKEILDLAKVESGHLTLSMGSVEVDAAVLQCLQQIQTLAARQDISLVYTEQPGCAVQADPARLRQVLLNLLSNAVKYNRPGGSVRVVVQEQGAQRLRLVVSDTGAGIAPERLPELFQPFSRLGAEGSAIEGTGVGLSIARRIAELMGGTLEVASEVGVSSSFWIELERSSVVPPAEPLPEPEAAGATDATDATGATAKATVPAVPPNGVLHTVLCIDDNPPNLRLMVQLLGRHPNIHTLSTTDPQTAVAMALAQRPTLILLDINMPGMDGFMVLKVLQGAPGLADIPVVAVSANALARDIARAMDAGFSEYLTKPLDLAQFDALLGRLLGSVSGPTEPDV
ncbi:MAG: ATP-binding protein [Burkholderiales bacterium]